MNWKKEEIEYLEDKFPSSPDILLSQKLNKSPNAIRIKASRLDLKKNSSIYRSNLLLNEKEEQIIIGGLLGDLHCRKTKTSKNARLEGGHSLNQKGYLKYKSYLLQRLKWIIWQSKDGSYHYQSKSFPCLNRYQQLFYINNKKIINNKILDKIDRLGLLIWYLDDGYYRTRDKYVCLHTNGFSYEEQLIIKKWFEEKWNIFPRIYRSKGKKKYKNKIWYYLYFPVSETIKLHNLFHNFNIPECMKYKFSFNHNYQNPISGALLAHD